MTEPLSAYTTVKWLGHLLRVFVCFANWSWLFSTLFGFHYIYLQPTTVWLFTMLSLGLQIEWRKIQHWSNFKQRDQHKAIFSMGRKLNHPINILVFFFYCNGSCFQIYTSLPTLSFNLCSVIFKIYRSIYSQKKGKTGKPSKMMEW